MRLTTAVFAAVALIFLQTAAAAHGIYVCDANGNEKSVFYTNESVYVKGSVPYPDNASLAYIINHTTWTERANLTVNQMTQKLVSTNSSNIIPVIVLWGDPKAGSYDVVLDVNGNQTYEAAVDYVDNLTAVGFYVYDTPTKKLNAGLTSKSPSSISVTAAGDGNATNMMHFFLSSSSAEDITVVDITLSPLGSGNEKSGVLYVQLIEDTDGDGVYNKSVGDKLLELCQYTIDKGICRFSFPSGFKILANKTTYFLITYTFTSNVSTGQVYQFQIPSITAYITSTLASLSSPNLPLTSAAATIASLTITTTSITTTTQTTTTIQATTTTTTQTTTTTTPSSLPQLPVDFTTILIIVAAVVVVIVVIVALVFLFRYLSKSQSIIIKE